MKITVSIVSYNSAVHLGECLKSLELLELNGHSLRILVVDNASSDKSVAVAESFDKVTVMASNKNLGFAGGHNLAIKKALADKSDWILILNPDAKVDRNLIVELLAASRLPAVGILSPKIYFWPGFEFRKNRYLKNELGKVIWYAGGKIDWDNVLVVHRGVDEVDKGQYDLISETDFATGAAMFVKAQVFDQIGLLNERYFLYFEDVEFCQRAKLAGFKVVYVPKAIVWHKWAQSTKGGSELQDYFITRNRLLFGFRHARARVKLALLKQAMIFLFKDPPKRWGVIDFLRCRFGEGSSLRFKKNRRLR